ncbi:Ff.00g113120.m01.CDS01 [Fusarium sp. VM40]|nr:Ff.00g113120.m01.CDS01 [Fusarium sp. VM40]
MGVLAVLIYVLKGFIAVPRSQIPSLTESSGATLRRCVSMRRIEEDWEYLEVFARILVGLQIATSDISTALEQGIELEWEDVYDVVNPFGDRRGGKVNSVWTFDLHKGRIFLTKSVHIYSAPLELSLQRPLTWDDFHPLDPENQTAESLQSLPEPYWDLKMDVAPRQRAFLGRILADFGHTWRHILRRQMNSTTFMKLAYAAVWISNMRFDIHERLGFEHVGGKRREMYVWVTDLPKWDSPQSSFFQVGSTWFVFVQQIQEGIEMARDHARSLPQYTELEASPATYAILTLRQITLCKMVHGEALWTRPEILFGDSPSDTAIDMMIWASDSSTTEPGPSRIHSLPVEIQDIILYYAASSSVSAGMLGCILDVGSPFPWNESGLKIEIQKRKRKWTENSPVEWYIMFHGIMSGISYKREQGSSTKRSRFGGFSKLQPGPHASPQTIPKD